MASSRKMAVLGVMTSLVVGAILLGTSGYSVALGMIDLGGPYGACLGAPVTFTAVTSGSPPLVFFRYDFNGDGKFDYPGFPVVAWSLDKSVTYVYNTPYTGQALVEAWDGVSTIIIGGKTMPLIVSDVADVTVPHDTVPPDSAFVFPVDGWIYTVPEFMAGQDGTPGTGDDGKFLGTAADPAPSCGIAAEHLAIQRQSDLKYYDAVAGDFTSAAVIWNLATITSGSGTSFIEWEFYFPADMFPDDDYQAFARATDIAGNVETTASARFFVTHADSLSGAVPGSAFCGAEACSFDIASLGSLSLNGASVSVEAGRIRVTKARAGPDAFMVPLAPNTRVSCTSGTSSCVYGIADHFVTQKGTTKSLLSNGVVSLHDRSGHVTAIGSGGGAVRFLRAIADRVHFEGSAPRQGPGAHDGSGTNLLYLAPSGTLAQVAFGDSQCARPLELGDRAVTRFHTVQGTVACSPRR